MKENMAKPQRNSELSAQYLIRLLYLTQEIARGYPSGPDAILKILQIAVEATLADFGSVLVYDSEKEALNMIAFIGGLHPIRENELNPPLGVTGEVARNRKTHVVSSTSAHPHFIRTSLFPDAQSELAVPILIGDELVGVIDLESKKRNNFQPEMVRVVELISTIAGMALRKEELVTASKEYITDTHINANRETAFVLMPFREPFNKYYTAIIKPAIEEANLRALRADEIYAPTQIINDIWNSIHNAKAVIVELTTRNPNVMYELGLCHAIGKPVIMISQSTEDIPFDLKHMRCILYDTTEPDWASKLRSGITKGIQSIIAGRIDSAPFRISDRADGTITERS